MCVNYRGRGTRGEGDNHCVLITGAGVLGEERGNHCVLITGAGVLGEEGDKVLWFSCQEMASFLRRWLLKKANMKVNLYARKPTGL